MTTCPTRRTDCPHDSLSGDEGPVAELGRMPTRWKCDECGTIIEDCGSRDPLIAGGRCVLLSGHRGHHQNGTGFFWAGDGVSKAMAQTRKLRLTAVLELDAVMYPPDDADAEQWLVDDILLGDLDRLGLHSSEIGDELGILRVEQVEPAS